MNGFWTIALGVGLQDGLNPCIFMACAVLIILKLRLSPRPLLNLWGPVIFVLVYALGVLAFDFGPAQIIVLHKYFITAAKILYFVLGLGSFVLGVVFIKDWFLLSRNLPAGDFIDKRIKLFAPQGWVVYLTIVIMALLLSAIATLWPINIYFLILGNEVLVKGQWQMVMPVLAVYIFASMWALLLAGAFISIKNLRPSTLKIFCAAIFLTASTTMIFIFK